MKKKWIGVGKTYPVSGEVPAFIKGARSKVLAVKAIVAARKKGRSGRAEGMGEE